MQRDSNDRQAFIDTGYYFLSMDTCPINRKVQLLGKGLIPFYGKWDGKDSFPVAWAPMPKIPQWVKSRGRKPTD